MIFWGGFRLFTASVRSRPPGPPAVPGVFSLSFFLTSFAFELNSLHLNIFHSISQTEKTGSWGSFEFHGCSTVFIAAKL